MPSVEENKLKKRNKILDAAYNLFAKNGEAKLSYNPETILKKYNIALNEYAL